MKGHMQINRYSGFVEGNGRPALGEYLHYNGRYYALAEQRIPYMRRSAISMLFVWNHALMGKLVSASFLGFILNITRHCTSGTGSKCREETADRFSGVAFFPAINIAVGPFEPPR